MPSTYSPSLKIELIANGEQAGTWGQTTNNNMGTLIEQAITGVGSLDLTGYSSYTLTNFNGLADEARNAVLVFSGIPSSACNVIAPTVEKTYIVTNNSTANVVIKTSAGNGITILPGLNSLIYCDGSEFYTAVNVNNVIGDLTVSGNVSVAGGTINLASSSMVSNANSMTFRSSSGIINMNTNTGAFTPPTGTVAQRPSSLALGMSRWNTDTGVYEIWTGTSWQVIASGSYSISYLVIAGGGGGGNTGFGGTIIAGGGGAGGYLSGTTAFSPGSTYTITVGAGGGAATQGANSSLVGIATAIGGGYGGQTVGGSGGSGGGNNGSGTVGQGNAGGSGVSGACGGGGGAGAVGSSASGSSSGGSGNAQGGNGGNGSASSITGSSVTYAGGGGGGASAFLGAVGAGSGGSGGGGAGAVGYSNPIAGTANTGGGGGGAGWNGVDTYGAIGGSGIVILSIPTASYSANTSGSPTVSTSGSNTILQYTSSGTYTA